MTYKFLVRLTQNSHRRKEEKDVKDLLQYITIYNNIKSVYKITYEAMTKSKNKTRPSQNDRINKIKSNKIYFIVFRINTKLIKRIFYI